jgi:hypothetical protein
MLNLERDFARLRNSFLAPQLRLDDQVALIVEGINISRRRGDLDLGQAEELTDLWLDITNTNGMTLPLRSPGFENSFQAAQQILHQVLDTDHLTMNHREGVILTLVDEMGVQGRLNEEQLVEFTDTTFDVYADICSSVTNQFLLNNPDKTPEENGLYT